MMLKFLTGCESILTRIFYIVLGFIIVLVISKSPMQCLVNLSTIIYNLCIGLLKKLETFSTYLSNLYKRLKFKKGNENLELQPSTPTKDDLKNCNLDENNCVVKKS